MAFEQDLPLNTAGKLRRRVLYCFQIESNQSSYYRGLDNLAILMRYYVKVI